MKNHLSSIYALLLFASISIVQSCKPENVSTDGNNPLRYRISKIVTRIDSPGKYEYSTFYFYKNRHIWTSGEDSTGEAWLQRFQYLTDSTILVDTYNGDVVYPADLFLLGKRGFVEKRIITAEKAYIESEDRDTLYKDTVLYTYNKAGNLCGLRTTIEGRADRYQYHIYSASYNWINGDLVSVAQTDTSEWFSPLKIERYGYKYTYYKELYNRSLDYLGNADIFLYGQGSMHLLKEKRDEQGSLLESYTYELEENGLIKSRTTFFYKQNGTIEAKQTEFFTYQLI